MSKGQCKDDFGDKRMYPRLATEQFKVAVTDGTNHYEGILGNISKFGIHIAQLPAETDYQSTLLSVEIQSNDATYKLRVKPKWDYKTDSSVNMGVVVVNQPLGWAGFINSIEKNTPS